MCVCSKKSVCPFFLVPWKTRGRKKVRRKRKKARWGSGRDGGDVRGTDRL
jgi:hypothetical protein